VDVAWDAVVVGGGVAGLAAATWLGRHRRRVLVVDRGEPRNRWVDEAHGYLGLDGIGPAELIERARRDLARYRTVTVADSGVVALRSTRCDAPDRPGAAFEVVTDDGTVGSRRLVLATGAADVLPAVEGLSTHYGADVVLCPACDGYEAEGRRVVVLGWGPHVPAFALGLLDWAASVTVLTLGRPCEADPETVAALVAVGIDVIEAPAVAFAGVRGDLRGVSLADGRLIECQRAFASIEVRPATGLAVQLGCRLDDDGYVVIDDEGETTVAGVYAAGDCVPGTQLLQVAAAQGAVAGIACAVSLRGEPAVPGAPTPAPTVVDVLPPSSATSWRS
jgi:thioredoxin reductase